MYLDNYRLLMFIFFFDVIIALVLQSTDRKSQTFLDVLIECELKQVISNSAVQQYAGTHISIELSTTYVQVYNTTITKNPMYNKLIQWFR